MRCFIPLLFPVLLFSSCCILPRTGAQSDRFDTHPPLLKVDCIPCGGLKNVNENFSFIEFFGASGSYSAGMELGHNFSNLRLYGAGGISYWPFRSPFFTVSLQCGTVLFDPEFMLRPEAGFDFSSWSFSGNPDFAQQVHPAFSSLQLKGNGTVNGWGYYGGMRFAMPYSSLNISFRLYRFFAFNPVATGRIYPGIVCGFRFGA